MAKAMCPGCSEVGTEKTINNHMRKCAKFAEVFSSDLDGRELNPVLAYAAAHPPKAAAARVSPKASAAVIDELADAVPLAAAGALVGASGAASDDVAPGDGVMGSSSQPEAPAPKAKRRRGARASAPPPPLTSSGSTGVVSVEYWDWEPSTLERLRAEAADRR